MARSLGSKLGFMLLWPGLFLYFLGSKRTRVVLLHEDEVLLIQDSAHYFFDDESWTLPGGGIKRGEEVNVAAAREVHEELGIIIEPDALEYLANQPSGSNGLVYQAHFLLYESSTKPKVGTLSHEVRAARWFTLDQASKLTLKREAQQGLALLVAHR